MALPDGRDCPSRIICPTRPLNPLRNDLSKLSTWSSNFQDLNPIKYLWDVWDSDPFKHGRSTTGQMTLEVCSFKVQYKWLCFALRSAVSYKITIYINSHREAFSFICGAAEFPNCSHSSSSHYNILEGELHIGKHKIPFGIAVKHHKPPRWTSNLLDFKSQCTKAAF